MIRLSDWKSPKDYDGYHGYLRLIFSMVDHREKNVTALKLNIAQCYYVDNEWILDWKYANSSIFEFLKEALSLNILYNHVNIENFYFHRSFDMLYRECENRNLISEDKVSVINHILPLADTTLEQNLLQYLDKEKLLSSFDKLQ